MTAVPEADTRRELVITEEILERIKSWDRLHSSPEYIKERKKTERIQKQDEKLLNEIFEKPVTRKRNLQLQEILQHIEYYQGKHARAVIAAGWLEKFKQIYGDKTIRGESRKRLRFLKSMRSRSFDVYEYKWDRKIKKRKKIEA